MPASIVSIVYSPEIRRSDAAQGYQRVSLTDALLRTDAGIVGDRKGAGKPHRQLNVMSREMLDTLEAEGFHTAPGEMGEQIVIAGLDIDALAHGDHLRLGDSAVIEIIKPRTGCRKFQTFQHKDPATVANRLGMMARVVADGPISVGSAVQCLADD